MRLRMRLRMRMRLKYSNSYDSWFFMTRDSINRNFYDSPLLFVKWLERSLTPVSDDCYASWILWCRTLVIPTANDSYVSQFHWFMIPIIHDSLTSHKNLFWTQVIESDTWETRLNGLNTIRAMVFKTVDFASYRLLSFNAGIYCSPHNGRCEQDFQDDKWRKTHSTLQKSSMYS